METVLFLIVYQFETDTLPLVLVALASIVTVISALFIGDKLAGYLYG